MIVELCCPWPCPTLKEALQPNLVIVLFRPTYQNAYRLPGVFLLHRFEVGLEVVAPFGQGHLHGGVGLDMMPPHSMYKYFVGDLQILQGIVDHISQVLCKPFHCACFTRRPVKVNLLYLTSLTHFAPVCKKKACYYGRLFSPYRSVPQIYVFQNRHHRGDTSSRSKESNYLVLLVRDPYLFNRQAVSTTFSCQRNSYLAIGSFHFDRTRIFLRKSVDAATPMSRIAYVKSDGAFLRRRRETDRVPLPPRNAGNQDERVLASFVGEPLLDFQLAERLVILSDRDCLCRSCPVSHQKQHPVEAIHCQTREDKCKH